jgi:hypothetical protein
MPTPVRSWSTGPIFHRCHHQATAACWVGPIVTPVRLIPRSCRQDWVRMARLHRSAIFVERREVRGVIRRWYGRADCWWSMAPEEKGAPEIGIRLAEGVSAVPADPTAWMEAGTERSVKAGVVDGAAHTLPQAPVLVSAALCRVSDASCPVRPSRQYRRYRRGTRVIFLRRHEGLRTASECCDLGTSPRSD